MLGARLRPERDGGSEPGQLRTPFRSPWEAVLFRQPKSLPRNTGFVGIDARCAPPVSTGSPSLGEARRARRAFSLPPCATGWGSDKPPGVSWAGLTTRAMHRVGRVTLEGGARAGRSRSRQCRPCVGPGLVPTCPLRRMAPPEVGLGREPTGVTLAQPLRIHRQRFR